MFGLSVLNSSGNEIIRVTDRLTRVAGKVTINGGQVFSPGSITVNNSSTGSIWYFLTPVQPSGSGELPYTTPIITISGSTIYWSQPHDDSNANNLINGSLIMDCILSYGVY